MKTSLGICAYNEEKNIGNLLERVVKEPLIDEIIVVASGCIDNTAWIASKYTNKVIIDPERRGKAVAINQFIKAASGDILILESADTLPSNFCFKHLLKWFAVKPIGMVGARPMPTNNNDKMGKIGHLLWETHHEMALKHPKSGEVCAFRNVIKEIDPLTPVDEASIEAKITKLGYMIFYEPKAIVFNRTPSTKEDFLKQRRRIYHGHLMLQKDGYQVPSISKLNILRAVSKTSKHYDCETIIRAGYYEWIARQQAKILYKYKQSNTIWEISNTTKGIK